LFYEKTVHPESGFAYIFKDGSESGIKFTHKTGYKSGSSADPKLWSSCYIVALKISAKV
jgi:hypothetical protein